MLTVKIDWSTAPREFLQAIVDNRNRMASEWNARKDEKYRQYCLRSGDPVLIAWAQSQAALTLAKGE